MNIIVCIKQVAHIYVQNGFDPQTKGIVSEGLVYVINPYDEIAVEEAIRLKEKAGSGTVTVMTIGPQRADDALKTCLAMGADRAVHVLDSETEIQDPWVIAQGLTELIKEMDYDLLLFGKMAIDHEMGQVGTIVAELLDLPVITAITKIEMIEGGKARVQRALERGNRQEAVCPVPAVFTAEKGLNRPRYPNFPDRKDAETAQIQQIDKSSLKFGSVEARMKVVGLAPPKPRPKKILAPDSSMSAADSMKFIMTGGMGDKKGGEVGGDAKKTAASIIDFLKEKNVVSN